MKIESIGADSFSKKEGFSDNTFASWALGAGELPEWVARSLGHVDTSMIYKTYGRYIRNLLRNDGTAFEGLYAERAAGSSEIVSKKKPF